MSIVRTRSRWSALSQGTTGIARSSSSAERSDPSFHANQCVISSGLSVALIASASGSSWLPALSNSSCPYCFVSIVCTMAVSTAIFRSGSFWSMKNLLLVLFPRACSRPGALSPRAFSLDVGLAGPPRTLTLRTVPLWRPFPCRRFSPRFPVSASPPRSLPAGVSLRPEPTAPGGLDR